MIWLCTDKLYPRADDNIPTKHLNNLVPGWEGYDAKNKSIESRVAVRNCVTSVSIGTLYFVPFQCTYWDRYW